MTHPTETDREQPKALELADWLDADACDLQTPREAATLLRTQHAELEDLRALLRTQRTVINDQQTELDRKSDAIQRLWAERDALRTEVERLNLELDAQRLPGGIPPRHLD